MSFSKIIALGMHIHSSLVVISGMLHNRVKLDVCSKLDSLNHQVTGQLHASDSWNTTLSLWKRNTKCRVDTVSRVAHSIVNKHVFLSVPFET